MTNEEGPNKSLVNDVLARSMSEFDDDDDDDEDENDSDMCRANDEGEDVFDLPLKMGISQSRNFSEVNGVLDPLSSLHGPSKRVRFEQRRQQQQQQQQQQQVYMSPQAENLNHMYALVNKLVLQLRKNQAEKTKILQSVDILSGNLNRYEKSEQSHDTTDNIALFNRFLEQRGRDAIVGEEQPSNGFEEDREDEAMLEILKRQNAKLRGTLEASKQTTFESMDLLNYSENSLKYVVAQLRENILMYHEETIKLVRQKFQMETIPSEDKEFKMYMENVNDLQELADISNAYRLLLRLHVQD